MNKRTWIERATKRASIIVMCAASAMVLQACGEGSEADVVRDGLDGKDGLPGLVGTDGKDGKDGLPGATGKDGPTGPAGMDGRDGLHGSDGLDGQNGQDGVDGKDGKDGLFGPMGLAGKDGKDGLDAGRVLDRAFQHSSAYEEQCAPENAEVGSAHRRGSLAIEKHWVRSMMDEAYLWRQDVPYVNVDLPEYGGSDGSTALLAYFDALRSPAFQPSGKRRDEHSQVVPKSAFDEFISGGEVPGFGIEWAVESPTQSRTRTIRVAYVQPGSEAERQGVERGDTLMGTSDAEVDGVGDEGAALLAASMFPRQKGTTHTFRFSPKGVEVPKSVTLTSGLVRQAVTLTKVFKRTTGDIGYLLFQEHNVAATPKLAKAILDFEEQGISKLVIDLRFNQGGDLTVASQLAYMIAGENRTAGKVFARLRGNQPGQEQTIPFHRCLEVGSGCSVEERLPKLNAAQVYVLTQAGTCAASEALINGLRGVGVEVVQIGSTTCGEPYAASPRQNCDHTYLPIDHLMVNEEGFAGFGDGFEPGGSNSNGLRGCLVADDFEHALGDPREALLSAAMDHVLREACPAQPQGLPERRMARAPWRDLLRGGAFIMPTR